MTGDYKVLRMDIVMDVGESLNPATDIGTRVDPRCLRSKDIHHECTYIAHEQATICLHEMMIRGQCMEKLAPRRTNYTRFLVFNIALAWVLCINCFQIY